MGELSLARCVADVQYMVTSGVCKFYAGASTSAKVSFSRSAGFTFLVVNFVPIVNFYSFETLPGRRFSVIMA